MADLPPSDDPDDTQSFSVSAALRAPVGTSLPGQAVGLVRSAGIRLTIGLVLVVADVRVSGFDVIPDTLGAIAVVWGVWAVASLASDVGPSRAGSRALAFALLHLALVVPADLPDDLLPLTDLGSDLVAAAQTVVALIGTSIVATVLARAHDALGQLGRRDRWGSSRRFCLALAVLWVPFVALAAFVGTDPGEVGSAIVGVSSVIVLGVGLLVLILLARSLAASVNVGVRVGFGEG